MPTFLSDPTPAFYLILAPRTRPPDERTRLLDQLDRDTPSVETEAHG